MQIAIVTDLASARGAFSLKAAATMYDLIYIVRTLEGRLDQQCQRSPIKGASSTEIDWLQEHGIIEFLDEVAVRKGFMSDDEIQSVSEFRKARYCEFLLLNSKQYEKMALAVSSFVARYLVAKDMVMVEADADLLPMTFASSYRLDIEQFFPGEKLTKPNLGSIGAAILKKYIKIPEESTPWEEVLRFREEKMNKISRISLRRFVRQLSMQDMTASDINDEIEQDMYLLERELANRNMSFQNATIEAVVVGAASLIQNCLKFELGDLAEKAFTVKSAHAELLASELEFVKRNTYFLVKANETFGQVKS